MSRLAPRKASARMARTPLKLQHKRACPPKPWRRGEHNLWIPPASICCRFANKVPPPHHAGMTQPMAPENRELPIRLSLIRAEEEGKSASSKMLRNVTVSGRKCSIHWDNFHSQLLDFASGPLSISTGSQRIAASSEPRISQIAAVFLGPSFLYNSPRRPA